MFSVDWLQITCFGRLSNQSNFTYIKKDYSTRQFKTIWDVLYFDELYFSVVSEPSSNILRSDMIIIKVLNQKLYTENYLIILDIFIKQNNLKFNNICRLDICYDFNEMIDYKDIQLFFTDFLTNKILYNGKSKYKIIGTQKLKHNIESLKFGSNTSDVSIYIYNKTKEMSEVKLKTYIVDNWKKTKLDLSKDVYRLEFSIKNSDKMIINVLDGDFINFSDDYKLLNSHLLQLYQVLLNKYFDFRINNNKKNKSRMLRVKMFEFESNEFIIKDAQTEFISDRMDKIFIKKLEWLNCELRIENEEMKEKIKDIQNDFIVKKGLSEYYQKKICKDLKRKKTIILPRPNIVAPF